MVLPSQAFWSFCRWRFAHGLRWWCCLRMMTCGYVWTTSFFGEEETSMALKVNVFDNHCLCSKSRLRSLLLDVILPRCSVGFHLVSFLQKELNPAQDSLRNCFLRFIWLCPFWPPDTCLQDMNAPAFSASELSQIFEHADKETDNMTPEKIYRSNPEHFDPEPAGSWTTPPACPFQTVTSYSSQSYSAILLFSLLR